MHCWLWQESEWLPASEIPLSDRGFRYGMAVFETVRIRAGRAEHVPAHLERLLRACRVCGFPANPAVLETAAALLDSGLGHSGVARLYASAGDGGPADAVHAPRFALLFEERAPAQKSAYAVRSCPGTHHPPFGGLKTANYWANALSLRVAMEAGAQEALLFNQEGQLIGGCMSNAFLRIEGRWYTPALECGARDGVMRAEVLARLPVEEGRVSREMVARADGALLTSSWIGVVTVRELDGRPLQIPAECEPLSAL